MAHDSFFFLKKILNHISVGKLHAGKISSWKKLASVFVLLDIKSEDNIWHSDPMHVRVLNLPAMIPLTCLIRCSLLNMSYFVVSHGSRWAGCPSC